MMNTGDKAALTFLIPSWSKPTTKVCSIKKNNTVSRRTPTPEAKLLPKNKNDGGLSRGAVIRIVVGSVLGILLGVAAIGLYCVRRQRRTSDLGAGYEYKTKHNEANT